MADSSTLPPKFPGLRQFQKFGESGPTYEVLSVDEKRGVARVHVFDNGEEFDYRLDRALQDPPA